MAVWLVPSKSPEHTDRVWYPEGLVLHLLPSYVDPGNWPNVSVPAWLKDGDNKTDGIDCMLDVSRALAKLPEEDAKNLLLFAYGAAVPDHVALGLLVYFMNGGS